jgi:hypothetical protein
VHNNKSNCKTPFRRLFARLRRFCGRGSAGQATVEYMLAIIILIVPMALALDTLFEALGVLFGKLGILVGRAYP